MMTEQNPMNRGAATFIPARVPHMSVSTRIEGVSDWSKAIAEIESLRLIRNKRDFDHAAQAIFEHESRTLQRMAGHLAAAAEAWNEVCPPSLAAATSLVGMSRGVLTVAVSNASAKYELDRVLRSGAEREFIRRCPMTVRKVRLVAGEPAAGGERGAT